MTGLISNRASSESEKGKDTSAPRLKPVSFFGLFRFVEGQDRVLLKIGCLAAVISGAALPSSAYILGSVVNTLGDPTVDPAKQMADVEVMCAVLMGVGAGLFVFSALWNFLLNFVAKRTAVVLKTAYLKAILLHDISWFDANPPAELPARIVDEIAKVEGATGHKVGLFLMNFSMFISGYVIGLLRGWQIGLLLFAAFPFLLASAMFMGKMIGQLTRRNTVAYGVAGAVVEETLTGIRTVVAYGGERRAIKKFKDILLQAVPQAVRLGVKAGVGLGTLMMVIFFSYALAFWFGGSLVKNEVYNWYTGRNYTGGDVVTVLMSLLSSTFALSQAMGLIQDFQQGKTAAASVYATIDDVPEIEEGKQEEQEQGSVDFGDLEFDDVYFAYPTRKDVPILKGVSLKIQRGEKVAFVGESGCGKSTMISLIERFYDPSKGEVRLNGKDVRTLGAPSTSLRHLFGYVGQEPILFGTSIRNNLKYGLPKDKQLSDKDLELACRKANAWDFISALPTGLDTYCGAAGAAQLSGGQKQRIAIARALLRNPQVLLLDEATSALDNESEKLVQATIEKLQEEDGEGGGLTTISIAHRLSTIRNSDRIFVFQRGEVVEVGTHEELMAGVGVYASLVAAQVASEKQEGGKEAGKNRGEEKAESRKNLDILNFHLESALGHGVPQAASRISVASIGDEFGELAPDEKEMEKKRVKDLADSYEMPWRRVFELNRKQLIFFLPACFGALLEGSQAPLNALFLSRSIGAFYADGGQPDFDKLTRMEVLYVGLGVMLLLACTLRFSSFFYMGEHFNLTIRDKAFKSIMRQDMSFHDDPEHAPGKLNSALSEIVAKMGVISGLTQAKFVQVGATVLVSLVVGFTGDPLVALVLCSVFPVLVVCGSLQAQVSFKAAFSKGGQDPDRQAALIASEAIQNMRTVRASCAEGWTVRHYEAYVWRPLDGSLRSTAVAGSLFGVSTAVVFFAYALGFWFGGHKVAYDGLDIDRLFQTLLAVIFGGAAAGQALAFMPDIAEAKAATHDLFEIIDAKTKIDALKAQEEAYPLLCGLPPSPIPPRPPRGAIEFVDVHFSYPSRPDVPILKGLSFSVSPGQRVAVVGPSGGGKSTVMALLQRFYDPLEGQVKVSGQDLRVWNLALWRESIGYVGQEPTLFDMSVEENVLYGKPSASFEEVRAAAAKANMLDFVPRSIGWKDSVGPKAGLLSGGQKQRVAIGRALVRSPDVLLLDEATSALDSSSEREVQRAIDEISRVAQNERPTTFIIAHRLTTIQDCDVILVVADGTLIERGTHENLMKEKGVYHNLFMSGQR